MTEAGDSNTILVENDSGNVQRWFLDPSRHEIGFTIDGVEVYRATIQDEPRFDGSSLFIGTRVLRPTAGGANAAAVQAWIQAVCAALRTKAATASTPAPTAASPRPSLSAPKPAHRSSDTLRGQADKVVKAADLVTAATVLFGVIGVIGGLVLAFQTDTIETDRYSTRIERPHAITGMIIVAASIVTTAVWYTFMQCISMVGGYVREH
ncbi:MAG TPA: hypothetical protein PLV68_10580 [Ilumatobacteraceae bacterium]|nr:hypothetical protein [Ilumatobacteraceae bacterium]